MSTSQRLSRSFYGELGVDGLASRTRDDWDDAIVEAVVSLLGDHDRIVDLGCGYGRIALPLASAGYHVTGLDLSPVLVAEAHVRATRAHVPLGYHVGSMVALPFRDAVFDAAICLWSAFNELLAPSEQCATLVEMLRVLAPGGIAIVEGAMYVPPTSDQIASRTRRGPEYRVSWDVVEGIDNPHFFHDESSYAVLCAQAGITDFEVVVQDWAGRPRQLLLFTKADEL